jgi:glycosyltransferase involved in cell wall biosynthesis
MKNLLYIGNKLSKQGFNQTTIETLSPLLLQEGFNVNSTSSKKNYFLRMLDMWFCVLKYYKSDFAIIDTYSTSSFWYAFTTSQLCRLLKMKYIPFLHGGNLPNRLQSNPKLCKMIFDNAYVNVAPSHYLKESFKEKGYINVTYIPNTIQINKYPFKERNAGEPKLLWVRAFASIYNPLMAIRVYKKVLEKFPNATLCMVGPDKDGSMKACKAVAQELGLNVRFTGKLSKKEWISLSSEYSIFINTTHFDNMPVSVIEAMGLGLAVVSTNVGGIPFLLAHNKDALLVPDSDVSKMVDAIEDLVVQPLLYQTLISDARQKAVSFDWEFVKEKWIKVLQ